MVEFKFEQACHSTADSIGNRHIREITDRVIDTDETNCFEGTVKWDAAKSLWFILMALSGITGGIVYFSWSALAVFFILSGITLCGGHSIGMHRKLIHNSFDCPKWLERIGVYLGTIVGLGGPFTMMQTHDMRDWAQRQPKCHDYFSHRSKMLKDFWWQVHCKLNLKAAPEFKFPDELKQDPFMIWLQRTAMLQQIPLAILLYLWGGWGFVFWGISMRVTASIFGHWIIGYYAHNQGHQDWIVQGACVQGHNVWGCGLITFGECWHNNHHAFPESAKLGLYKGQADPGWWVLKTFEKLGAVSNLTLPPHLPKRGNLKAVTYR